MTNEISIAIIEPFKKHFRAGVYRSLVVLVVGAILCPKSRTISRCLRVLGLQENQNYRRYYYALSQAKWSCIALSQSLLKMLIPYAQSGDSVLRFNLDDTLVRRSGKEIKLKGKHHDAVRSRGRYKVISLGIRWLSLQLNCKFPWSTRYWSLPIMTVPCPSATTCEKEKLSYRSFCALSKLFFRLLRRWLPEQQIEVLADNGFQTAELYLLAHQLNIRLITRSRADICLYDQAPTELPKGRRGPKPKKGARQSTLAYRFENNLLEFVSTSLLWYKHDVIDIEYATGTALWHRDGVLPIPVRWFLVTSPDKRFKPSYFTATCFDGLDPQTILQSYRHRWNCEVTFQDLRFSLGLETQRHWSVKAINRITPLIFGLYSIVCLFIADLNLSTVPRYQAAWYPASRKSDACFNDILACARNYLWDYIFELADSRSSTQFRLIPLRLFHSFKNALAFAA